MLGELNDAAGGAIVAVREGEDERFDVALEKCPDTHRARFERREDRGTREPFRAELAGGFPQGDDDGMRGRIVRLPDTVVGAGDHRLVDDGHGSNRTLTERQGISRLGEGFAHEQLVVHAPDYTGHRTGRSSALPLRGNPNRNRLGPIGRASIAALMAATRRIGILTGGGDVPGLNSVIKSVVYRSTALGYEIFGIRRGWEGLTHLSPGPVLDSDYVRRLDRVNTRTIDRTGGTWLHTSRTNPRKMRGSALPAWLDGNRRAELATDEDDVYDLTPVVLDNIARLGIDVLVTIGGDDTLSFSRALVEQGIPLVAIPKTMDNDVQGTEYCIGFSTAITRAREAINRQRTTLGSHERIGIFRIFGRDAGFSALYAAYVTSARCVIPEAPYDLDRLAALLAEDHGSNPSHYAMVITAEGATWQGVRMQDVGDADMFGHRHKANVGEALAVEIKRRTGIETVASELTYDLRSGEPDSLDSMVAMTFANVAMDLIRDGVTGRMVAIRDGKYAHADLPEPGLGPRRVDVAEMYDEERFRPRYEGKLGDPLLLVGLASGVIAG